MIRVRFAPSPTGYLHLGNIRTALFNFLFAKANGGEFVLRIEDTDRERSRKEYADAQMEDLLWMGLQWDDGPHQQSQRLDLYHEHLAKLLKEEKAYLCYVTEEEIAQMREKARSEKRSLRFDNRGREFSSAEIEKRKAQGIKPTVRFKIDAPVLEVDDMVRGKVSFNLDDMVGDFVIARPDGMPTFHLAVCVDDCLMNITHVIRGEDHLSNTPRHILLMKAMGFQPPRFGHLSLVHGPGGEPLSKRLEAVSVREFRRKGYLPHALANYIALLGWSPGEDREILSWMELQKDFDISRVSRSSSNFDPQKLDWLNGQHLRLLSDDDFTRQAMDYLKTGAHLEYDEALVESLMPAFKDKIERFEQLNQRLEILKDDFPYEDASLIQSPEARLIFQAGLEVLPGLDEGSDDLYQGLMNALKPKVNVKGKQLFHPLRMALTGKLDGPELKRVIPVFGIDRIKKCFERALLV